MGEPRACHTRSSFWRECGDRHTVVADGSFSRVGDGRHHATGCMQIVMAASGVGQVGQAATNSKDKARAKPRLTFVEGIVVGIGVQRQQLGVGQSTVEHCATNRGRQTCEANRNEQTAVETETYSRRCPVCAHDDNGRERTAAGEKQANAATDRPAVDKGGH